MAPEVANRSYRNPKTVVKGSTNLDIKKDRHAVLDRRAISAVSLSCELMVLSAGRFCEDLS